jgi:hypothetical protein
MLSEEKLKVPRYCSEGTWYLLQSGKKFSAKLLKQNESKRVLKWESKSYYIAPI